jgi:formylmethanofuran dehydrogenase subunit E
MNIGKYSLGEYSRLIESFHGSVAPGLLIGGIMVDAALERMDKAELYDAICETRSCLPDAIQLLTPCTVGNGWLHIVNLGRFALTLYEKHTGKGVRVFLSASSTEMWPEVRNWYLKLKPKKEQDREALNNQIVEANVDLLGFQNVNVLPRFLTKRSKGEIALCPVCGEAYPSDHGPVCRGCGDPSPYIGADPIEVGENAARNLLPMCVKTWAMGGRELW